MPSTSAASYPVKSSALLLKRLTRDGELRESFGRYALIGEALRGSSHAYLTKGFADRVNGAIDGEPLAVIASTPLARAPRWWRPLAGAAVAAGVAAIAVVALQQRAVAPDLHAALPVAARSVAMTSMLAQNGSPQAPREAISYTVPASTPDAPAAMPAARLTNYVFAHSKYSSGLDQRGVMADMLIETDEQQPTGSDPAAPAPALRTAP